MISGGEKSRKHLKYYVIHGVNEISLVSRGKGRGRKGGRERRKIGEEGEERYAWVP